jgi:hypothetical protein
MKFFKELLEKNIGFFIVTIALLLIVVGSGVYFATTLGKKYSLEGDINSKMQTLDRLSMGKGGSPTLAWIDYLNSKEEALVKIYNEAESYYNRPVVKMPKNVLEPLKLKEKIFEKQKEMRKEAYADQLELKEEAISFGFREYETKIPTESEVPYLTKQLDIIQQLVALMGQSRIETLSSVEFLRYKDESLETSRGNIDYRIFPVRISTISQLKNFSEFLHKVSTSDYVFIVEELNMSQSEDFREKVESSLVVSCIVFKESDEK